MITREEFRTIAGNGIWKQNTSIAQILGLCPLLAVTTNAVNGIMLSLATIIVMAMSNFAVASLAQLHPARNPHPGLHPDRRRAGHRGRPAVQRQSARTLSGARHLHPADRHQLHRARPRRSLRRQEPAAAIDLRRHFHGRRHAVDAGPARRHARTARQRHASWAASTWSSPSLQPIQLLPENYPGFLLAMLPPGAFILLGCMIAWKNWMDARAAERAQRKPPQPQPAVVTH